MRTNDCYLLTDDTMNGNAFEIMQALSGTISASTHQYANRLQEIDKLEEHNIRLKVLISDCYDYFNMRNLGEPAEKLKQRLSDAIDGKDI